MPHHFIDLLTTHASDNCTVGKNRYLPRLYRSVVLSPIHLSAVVIFVLALPPPWTNIWVGDHAGRLGERVWFPSSVGEPLWVGLDLLSDCDAGMVGIGGMGQ